MSLGTGSSTVRIKKFPRVAVKKIRFFWTRDKNSLRCNGLAFLVDIGFGCLYPVYSKEELDFKICFLSLVLFDFRREHTMENNIAASARFSSMGVTCLMEAESRYSFHVQYAGHIWWKIF